MRRTFTSLRRVISVAIVAVAGCQTAGGPAPPPTAPEVKSLIDAAYRRPDKHTVKPSARELGRPDDHVIVWVRQYDGVDLGSEARSQLAPAGDHWDTHWMRELAEPEPVRRDALLSFDRAARAVGLDDKLARGVVHGRLIYRPELELIKKVAEPKNATDVEVVIKQYRLAVELVDDEGKRTTWVDAYSGERIGEVSHWKRTAIPAPTMKYGSVPLDTTKYVKDPGAILKTYYYTFKDPLRTSLTTLTGPVNGQGVVRGNPTGTTAPLLYAQVTASPDYANDVGYDLKEAWDYYQATFGRRGLRNLRASGTATANDAIAWFSNVPGSPLGTNLAMDETTGLIQIEEDGQTFWQQWVTADVVGHEWTHAVFAEDTGLASVYWGATGGINEANSDLFGQMIEARARSLAGLQASDDIRDGWVYAQDALDVAPSTKRYMCQPSLSPDSAGIRDVWSVDIDDPAHPMDPHVSMGPIDRVFCLLGRGMLPNGSSTSFPELQSSIAPKGFAALGAKTVASLQYNALLSLRGLAPYASFTDERNAMLGAATAVYGQYSDEYKAIEDAFAVVLVGPPADRTPPIVTLTSGLMLNQHTPITVSVQSANNITSVAFQLDAINLGTLTAPPWQLTPSIEPEGQHTLYITAVDEHLNKVTNPYAVVFDGSSPIITLTDVTPCAPNTFCPTYQHSRLYRVAATDYSGVASVSLYVDGPPVGVATGTSSNVFTVNYAVGGQHYLQARASDTLGNGGASAGFYFDIDMTPPTYSSGPTWIPDYANNNGTVEGRIWFKLCASDPAGIHGFGVELDGTWASVVATPTTPGCSTLRIDKVALGAHAYRVHAYDNWNNDAVSAGNFTLKGIPPTLATPIVSVDPVTIGRITVPTSYSATNGIHEVILRVCQYQGQGSTCIDRGMFYPATAADQTAHTFTVSTGLTPGQTYFVQVSVAGNNALVTEKQSDIFTIANPFIVYTESENPRNDDFSTANWPPANTAQIKGTYNGAPLPPLSGLWDGDAFGFSVPAGKSLYVTSGFNCPHASFGIYAWDPVDQEWYLYADHAADGTASMSNAAWPSNQAPSTNMMLYVTFQQEYFSGWSSPTTPGCSDPRYTLNVSVH